jgi:hypothetical protein
MMILAQVTDPRLNFWNGANASPGLWAKIGVGFIIGLILMAAISQAPPRVRRWIVAGATFLAGFVYIGYWLWPAPIARESGTLPNGPIESVGFFFDDSVQVVGDFYNILAGLLLGLGIFSVLRIHVGKLIKQQRDWGYSIVLLVCMVAMIVIGYWDYPDRIGPNAALLDVQSNWSPINYARDFLFDGMLQTMDAAMFSVIAFYILSAAYRAFRIRSIEATILLAAALIMMLSLMPFVAALWNGAVDAATPHITQHGTAIPVPDSGHFLQNLRLTNMSQWLKDTMQTSSLRGIDFGVGIGTLAMAMRLWLSLERGGVSQ